MAAEPSPSPAETLRILKENSHAIILDFDGLLADSEPFHYKAYNEVFQRYGHSLDQEEYWVEWTSKGKGIAGEIERHDLKLEVDPIELRRQKFEVYSRFCQNGDIKLFPETIPLAKTFSASHQMAIASGSWIHDIKAILKNANALDLFPNILGKESAPREKPHPDIFLKAAESMNCSPDKCLVVEDALKGLAAAKMGGMPCLIIQNQLNQQIDFSEANLVVASLGELISFLRR